jgi:hypothetical protein
MPRSDSEPYVAEHNFHPVWVYRQRTHYALPILFIIALQPNQKRTLPIVNKICGNIYNISAKKQ